jgi:hypothetical protein
MKDQLLDVSLECFDLLTAHKCAVAQEDMNLAKSIKHLLETEQGENASRARICELML